MAVQLIVGSSGAGKSYQIYHKIITDALAHPDHDFLVIVPEQFTLQTQKELVRLHPGGGILNIDVLSFQRLAYRVFEETGRDARQLLEETGKALVLEKVVQLSQNKLSYLGSQMHKPGYLGEMKSLISELMQYDVDHQELSRMLREAEGNALLSKKMQDVQVLYDAFCQYLSERFLTAEEVLTVLSERLCLSEKIRRSTIVLDGFTGFTPVQYQVLRELMQLCPDIYVTVTMGEGESLFGPYNPCALFAMSRQMAEEIRQMARETGTTMKDPWEVDPTAHSRFAHSPALHHLEQRLFRYGNHPYSDATEEIALFAAPDPRQEMREVARQIAALVRTEGLRYADIAVITGDLKSYGTYARQVFDEADIPCFIDQKHAVLMNPFVEYVRSALDVMQHNFSYESVFRHLRCGLSGLSSDEIDQLENYVIALGIRGAKRWQESWTRLYRGMDPAQLPVLNDIRVRATEGLLAFAQAFKRRGNTVADDTRALYAFLVQGEIQQKLKVQELAFSRQGNGAMEKEYAQIYGIVMNLLDQMVEILGDEKIGQRAYIQLVEAGLAEATVGVVPPGVDQVLVGDMQRTRLRDIKVLFFVGVNDGIIPQSTGSGGILSESDREFFLEQGIKLAPTPREAMYEQRFYLYLHLTKPDRHLFLSYSYTDGKGQKRSPAYLIGMIENLFPRLAVREAGSAHLAMTDFERPQDGMEALRDGLRACLRREPDDDWKELYRWYHGQPDYQELLGKLLGAAFCVKPEDRISKGVAKALYGEISRHSATRLEQYCACAFAHFLRYGMSLSERVEYEFTPADLGTLLHEALELFSERLRENGLEWRRLSDLQRDTFAEASMDSVAADYGNTILHSSVRNEYQILRCKKILKRTVWALQQQLQDGQFVPEGFEVSIGGGRIDRLDICQTDRQVLVKVIDYKTGGTSFDLLAVYHGLQMQLMVYLDGALQTEECKYPDREVIPAGVFYYHVKDPLIAVKAERDVEDLGHRMRKELKLNGLVNEDPEIMRKMDATLESLPVSQNKNGGLSGSRSSIASTQQLFTLRHFVSDKTKQAVDEIAAGNAAISPYTLKGKTACDYCPYKAVCGFDPRIPGYQYRRLRQYSDEEIWREIFGEGKER